MAKQKYTPGDVVKHRDDENENIRIILYYSQAQDEYLYAEWYKNIGAGLVYKPFNASVRRAQMEKTHTRYVGRINEDDLMGHMNEVAKAYNEAHVKSRPHLEKIENMVSKL